MMFRRRTPQTVSVPEPIIQPVVTTPYSVWYWHSDESFIRRTDYDSGHMDSMIELSAENNNLRSATKRAARKEYDRILGEEHSQEERLSSG
jgi:hypothetical protein